VSQDLICVEIEKQLIQRQLTEIVRITHAAEALAVFTGLGSLAIGKRHRSPHTGVPAVYREAADLPARERNMPHAHRENPQLFPVRDPLSVRPIRTQVDVDSLVVPRNEKRRKVPHQRLPARPAHD
jgi:hypothetical protein